MKTQFQSLGDKVRESMRRLCGRVPADRRAAVIISMVVLFGVLNFWMMVRAIQSFSKDNSQPQQIEQTNTQNYDTTISEIQQEQH